MAGNPSTLAVDDRSVGRPNELTVDLGAITHNVTIIRSLVGNGVRLFASMKANAYGFGVRMVAPVLRDAGVDALAMVDLRDALALRGDGIELPILLYGGNLVDECLVRTAEERSLMVTVPDWTSATRLASLARRPIRVYAEVDVGLERLGFPVSTARECIGRLESLPNLELGGIYTHMHVPRQGNPLAYVDWQFDRFEKVLSDLREDGIQAPVTMAASSDVLALTSAMNLDAVDVGKMLFGTIRPTPGIELRCAFASLTSRLTQVTTVERREYVDQAPMDVRPGMRIGIVPMGIADGLSGLTCRSALVRGRRARIVGELSLEHCRLDLTGIGDAAAGDEVVLIGTQGSEEIRLADLQLCESGAALWRAAPEVRASVARVYQR